MFVRNNKINTPPPQQEEKEQLNPIECPKCKSQNIAYLPDIHKCLGLRIFSYIVLTIGILIICGNAANKQVTTIDELFTLIINSIEQFIVPIFFFIVIRIIIIFKENKTHVKCVCKDCGTIWIFD